MMLHGVVIVAMEGGRAQRQQIDQRDAMEVEIEPRAVSLTLEGPAAVLDTLSSGDVSVLLSLAGRPPATYRMSPEVILPPGVRLTATSADTLQVRVFRTGR